MRTGLRPALRIEGGRTRGSEGRWGRCMLHTAAAAAGGVAAAVRQEVSVVSRKQRIEDRAQIVLHAHRGSLPQLLSNWAAEGRQLGAAQLSHALVAAGGAPLGDGVLRWLAAQEALRTDPADAQAVGHIIGGLRSQSPSPAMLRLLSSIARFVKRCTEPLKGSHVAGALFGLQQQPDTAEARAVLLALAPLAARCPCGLTADEAASALYGLRMHSGGAAEQVLAALGPLVRDGGRGRPPGLQELGRAAYGLQRLAGTAGAVGALRGLWCMLERCEQPLDAITVATLLYGVQRHTGNSYVHRRLLSAVAAALPSAGPFAPRDVAAALYGLHRQGTGPAVRAVLLGLAPQVRGMSGELEGQLGATLYGLREQTDTLEARHLLSALAGAICRSSEPVDGQQIANALYGLKCQTSNPGVRAALLALCPVIGGFCGVLSPTGVLQAMHGLNGQEGTPEAGAVLAALIPVLQRGRPPFTALSIGPALCAIRGQPESPAARALLHMAVPCLPEVLDTRTASQTLYGLLGLAEAGVGGAVQAVGRVLQRLPRTPDGGTPTGLLQAVNLAGAVIPDALAVSMKQQRGKLPSRTERALRAVIHRAGVPGVFVSTWHQSGFEMDVLCGKVNVELDGPHYRYTTAGRKRYFALRDRVLSQAFGIEVQRVKSEGLSLRQLVDAVAERCAPAGGSEAQAAWKRARHLARLGWVWAEA
eukprot:TRINITY_DN65398_c0_g1_i1.p1 TRINITY_DN65398_c0_g1~~TRINITY_DN65398_c0_g1_i1.p1  ORF type:complete len:703 (+),score=188.95 TRINITY_DN65398_c0_g1_i1:21-2129(+)